jgi:hypothetical protein
MEAPVVPAVFTVHTMVLLVAFAGSTVPVMVRGIPTVPPEGTPVIPLTATAGGLTVTVQFAVNPPSAVVTVITAVPADTAYTVPPDTVATPVLLLDQLTF